MEKSRSDYLTELDDLGLNADALQELVVAARINQEACAPGTNAAADDATTVIKGATATAPAALVLALASATLPTAPPKQVLLFAAKYANSRLLAAHASLVKNFMKNNVKEAAELLLRYQNYDPDERPCFVICTIAPTPRFRELHGFNIYPPKLAAPTQYDNNPYVFHGNSFDGNAPPTYDLNSTWLRNKTAYITSITTFEHAIKDNNNALVSTGSSKVEQVRSICLLLTELAPILMEHTLSPTAALPSLRAFATKHKILTSMNPFFTWLSTMGQNENDKLRVDVFTPEDMGPELNAQRCNIAMALIGSGTSPAATSAAPVATIVDKNADVIKILAATIASALPGSKPATAPKTLSARWSHQLLSLLHICQVPDEISLMIIWWEGAKCKKAEFRGILTFLLRERAKSPGIPVPYANHQVANKVHNQEFIPTNKFDLTDGISVWDFPKLTPAELALQLEFTCEWTKHLEGRNNPTLAETRGAMKTAKIAPVFTFVQLFAHVAHFEVFLDVCFGNTHIAFTKLRYLRQYLQEGQLPIERALATDCLLGSQIVTMIRLQITGFLRTVCKTSDRIILPDLTNMTDALCFGTWRPHVLPLAITSLLHQLRPAPTHPQPAPTPYAGYQQRGTVPFPAQTPSIYNWQQGPPQPYSPPRNNGQSADRDCNHTFNPGWMFPIALKPIILHARTVQGGEVPLTDYHIPFCITFQYKGECRSNCQGRPTHSAPSTAEFARLSACHCRFCLPVTGGPPPPQQPLPPAPTSYTQPMLQGDLQAGHGTFGPGCGYAKRGGHGGCGGRRSSSTPTVPQLPPVPLIVASNPPNNGSSTLGTGTHN